MSKIEIRDLSVKFRIYHDRSPSIKSYFSNLIRRKAISEYSEFSAINNVTFTISAGERVGIIGQNGAGKSTLLKTICRIYEPSVGKVNIKGRIAPLLEIGAGFHPEFTGAENIRLNGAILGYTQKQIREIESEVVAFSELEEFIDTPVKYYSTGMYLRLAFSLATAVQPEILILDELFAGGDTSFVKRATARMQKIIEGASILIVVSHDMNLLGRICNRIIWMDHGCVKMDGNAQDVLSAYSEFCRD